MIVHVLEDEWIQHVRDVDRTDRCGGSRDPKGRGRIMAVDSVKPILNVSDIEASVAWFEKLGWRRHWEWGEPPTFGAVIRGTSEIFLCLDGQGARGGPLPRYPGDEGTGGVWMAWWLDSPAAVDALHELAVRQGVTVTAPPRDNPWNTRECHLRHPDGHTIRVSAALDEE